MLLLAYLLTYNVTCNRKLAKGWTVGVQAFTQHLENVKQGKIKHTKLTQNKH